MLSIISPVYKAEETINELVRRIEQNVIKITTDYEIILVEDGSPDNSWEIIKELALKNNKVVGLKLSRNFGQHKAVRAGLHEAKGNWLVILDCDLQDDPAYIFQLLDEAKKGNQIVFTKRLNRKHNLFKKLSGKIYNLLFGLMADKKFDVNTGSLVLFSDQVKKELLKLTENDLLYIQMLKWIGFKSSIISVEHSKRHHGESSYNIYKLLNLAINGWITHSTKLLKLSIYVGLSLSVISFICAGFVLYGTFFMNYQVGWPSLFIAILFSTGVILISLGILGLYIGNTFNQVKRRPLYIIEKKTNQK